MIALVLYWATFTIALLAVYYADRIGTAELEDDASSGRPRD